MRLFFAIIIIALSSALGFAQEAEFSLKKPVHKFSKCDEGTILTHSYEVVNTGDSALVINDYKVGCPCTTLTWPEDPIQPGDTAQLTVSFDTKGKYYFQDRTIYVLANTKKGMHKLRFKVTVKPEE